MVSITSQAGAMAALQSLRNTQTQLQTTQGRLGVNTGAAGTQDNSAASVIAQSMNSQIDALSTQIDQAQDPAAKSFYSSLKDSLTEGLSAVMNPGSATEQAGGQSQQTRQALGSQTLSLANNAPQALISLFA